MFVPLLWRVLAPVLPHDFTEMRRARRVPRPSLRVLNGERTRLIGAALIAALDVFAVVASRPLGHVCSLFRFIR